MSTVTISTLRVGRRRDRPVTADARPPVSWTVDAEPGWVQSAARLRLDGERIAELEGEGCVLVAWPFEPLQGRRVHTLELQVVGDDGSASDWSAPVTFSVVRRTEPWTAPSIGLAHPDRPAQPVYLRREFDVEPTVVAATLDATAHGVYQVAIDGVDVDDHVLKPGWTSYRHRLALESTDVSALLRPGRRQALTVRMAGGWFTERYGFGSSARRVYGDQPAVSIELRLEHSDGRVESLRSDERWRASSAVELESSGLYAGETRDARRHQEGWDAPGFDDGAWEPVAVVPLQPSLAVEALDVEPVRRIEERPPLAVLTTPSGATVLDFGQNLVGRVRFTVEGPRGATVTLRHAEVLEQGELCVRALRAAESIDRFTLAGRGPVVMEPEFTFHGFRYVEVSGWPGELRPEAFRAVVLHTDLDRTGGFGCSDHRLERLHDNVVWSLRGNAVGLPTDCPQRDERMGWTGDAQVFAPAAASLFGVDAFLATWLDDLALEQGDRAGLVPTIIPDVLGELSDVAAAGWGDAATVVPTVLHERYGDVALLRRCLPSMRAWVDRAHREAGPSRLWETGFQYGDWLDPIASRPDKAATDPGLVATAYLYRSTRLLADAYRAVAEAEPGGAGEHDGEDLVAAQRGYAALAEEVRQAFRHVYLTPAGRLMSDAPTAYALTLAFGLVDDEPTVRRLGERLAFLLRARGYRMATGFLGTPVVLDALLDSGRSAAAEQLLLQDACPSWLYPVTMGATTMWERWDSMLPDGSINPSGMTSFNHYALGSVADVLHRRVGGLAPAAPGYRRVRIRPWLVSALDHARVHQETPYGRAAVSWRRSGGSVTVVAELPAGVTASVELPDRPAFETGSGRHEWVVDEPRSSTQAPALGVDADLADLADRPGVCALVSRRLAGADPELGREFDEFVRWVPGRTLRAELAAVSPPPELVASLDAELRTLTAPAS
ncbi:alpha-L-rhamnosidase [Humibacter sp. BT305]|nr:alpha-L-rhamnosidase [Humibacter sp. BT305]